MADVEFAVGLLMLTVSAILLTVYIVPRLDVQSSQSMPRLVAAMVTAALLWCAGAKINAWGMTALMSNGSSLFHVDSLRASLRQMGKKAMRPRVEPSHGR